MKRFLLLCGMAMALGACTDDDEGRGSLSVEIWGEEYIEEGIPESTFVDGWSVTFDRFLVAVDGIAVARGEGAADLSDDGQRIFDLTRPGPMAFLTAEVPAGHYGSTDYVVRPAESAATAETASADDLELMTGNGFSVYAEGSATDGTDTKTFAWGFTTATAYGNCESAAEVADGGAATVQLTIHADHLFYDDLFAADPNVTFETLAQADTDADGEVTEAELAAFDIMALPNYGTGSLRVENLWDFISHLTGTLGHIDGEGHCEGMAHDH